MLYIFSYMTNYVISLPKEPSKLFLNQKKNNQNSVLFTFKACFTFKQSLLEYKLFSIPFYIQLSSLFLIKIFNNTYIFYRGEKLYFNQDTSRKLCPNLNKGVLCGIIVVVVSVVLLLCVLAASKYFNSLVRLYLLN